MIRFTLFLCFCFSLWSADYDVVVVGTSPVCLFEAAYHHFLGKSVAIFEAASECGGAWKAIDICGVKHADLGCHQIGQDRNLSQFLTDYAGCKIVWMDAPDAPLEEKGHSGNGHYFSKGCFELINNMEKMIRATSIDLFLNRKVDRLWFDVEEGWAVLKAGEENVRAKKVYCTNASSVIVAENKPAAETKYYHAYLLVADPEPPRFSYRYHGQAGVSRAMNLTPFVDLEGTGCHLIVLQLHGEKEFGKEHEWILSLKEKQLLSPGAFLVRSENHIYAHCHAFSSSINRLPTKERAFLEILNTSSFHSISSYIPKWKEALPLYAEFMSR